MKFSSEIWTRKRCKYAVHLKRKRCLRVSDSVAWLHLKKNDFNFIIRHCSTLLSWTT